VPLMASGTFTDLPEAAMEHRARRPDPQEIAIALLCRLWQEDEAYLRELVRRMREPSADEPQP
jgi:hypothetical protein